MNRKSFLKRTLTTIGLGAITPSFLQAGKITDLKEPLDPIFRGNADAKKLYGLRDNLTIYLEGKDTDGQYIHGEQYNPPGFTIPPHAHTQEDEVFHVIEGEVEFTVGGETKVLKTGDVCFAPKEVPHIYTVIGDKKARVVFSIYPAGLEGMFEELDALPAGPPDLEKVAEICGRYGVSFV